MERWVEEGGRVDECGKGKKIVGNYKKYNTYNMVQGIWQALEYPYSLCSYDMSNLAIFNMQPYNSLWI